MFYKFRVMSWGAAAWCVLSSVAHTLPASASEPSATVREAVEVLEQIMQIPEQQVPPSLLRNSHGIAIIPGVIKVGFIVGGHHGSGLVVVRNPSSGVWGHPVFVTLTGGSLGWQIGAQSSDVILVFKSRRGVDGMINGKFTLGADAAVAAGPVGRKAEVATDAGLKAEIYSYSRSRGLFAGVSLEGSAIEIDRAANRAYYGDAGERVDSLLTGEGSSAPADAEQLKAVLGQYAR